MSFDASERAFKLFAEAYGKAWAPPAPGLSVMVPSADNETGASAPLSLENAPATSLSPDASIPMAL